MELAKSRFPKLLKTLQTKIVDRAIRGLQFFASKRGHRFDPGHIHQPNQCEDAWREHYGVRYLKGFKTATSKCLKSRSFRVATVRP